MNAQVLERIIAFGQAYGPWALAALAAAWLSYLAIKRRSSLEFEVDVGRRR